DFMAPSQADNDWQNQSFAQSAKRLAQQPTARPVCSPDNDPVEKTEYFTITQFINNADEDGLWDDTLEIYLKIVQPSLLSDVQSFQYRRSAHWLYDEQGQGWKSINQKLWQPATLSNAHLIDQANLYHGWYIELWEQDALTDDYFGRNAFDIEDIPHSPGYKTYSYNNGAKITTTIKLF
ncbi:MAG: hypothetical protein MJK04_14885, partial [Psychrosphaera sp.]|nr:hypothetical protein [Psychrosphaera sp.]